MADTITRDKIAAEMQDARRERARRRDCGFHVIVRRSLWDYPGMMDRLIAAGLSEAMQDADIDDAADVEICARVIEHAGLYETRYTVDDWNVEQCGPDGRGSLDDTLIIERTLTLDDLDTIIGRPTDDEIEAAERRDRERYAARTNGRKEVG